MFIFAWILLGLVAGFYTSSLVDRGDQRMMLDMILGVMGAFVGGAAFCAADADGSFDVGSVFASLVGSITFLLAYHAIRGRRATRMTPSRGQVTQESWAP